MEKTVLEGLENVPETSRLIKVILNIMRNEQERLMV